MAYVLVACEESQIVCNAFREKGHEAYSCDIQDCSGGHPEWHIKGDVLNVLEPHYYDFDDDNLSYGIFFLTSDSVEHYVSHWDLIIAHPPCTYLTFASAVEISKHPDRIPLGFVAKKFFLSFLNCSCPHVCIENPPPLRMFSLPSYSQLVRPYMFGDVNNKKVCLWLRGLPKLYSTSIFYTIDSDIVRWIGNDGKMKSCSRWYNTNTHIHSVHRSKFFPGIASAMAEQWSDLI